MIERFSLTKSTIHTHKLSFFINSLERYGFIEPKDNYEEIAQTIRDYYDVPVEYDDIKEYYERFIEKDTEDEEMKLIYKNSL